MGDSNYRVEEKQQVTVNNKRRTQYHIFELNQAKDAYIHVGKGFTKRHATDAECIDDWLSKAEVE